MWKCVGDGACCTQPSEVVMTHAERAEVERAARHGAILRFVVDADPRFTRLQAAPCPLYDAAEGCTVYAVRPFNCRRFACQRTDYETQAYDQGPQTRHDRRQLVVIQRHAQRWGRSHGWEAS
jgi:Fe-S-cluster containining protein